MMLIIQQGPDAGRKLRLERGLLTIGRGGECDLVLQETRASRRHAELRRQGDQWLIVDLESTNGTAVGDVRLQPQMAHPLLPGTPVSIGDTRFVLQEEPQDRLGSLDDWSQEEWVVDVTPAPPALVWELAAWLSRGLVLAGCGLLVWGSLNDWLRVQVRVPLLGTVVDRTFGGMDSGQAWLFFGVAALALLLMAADLLSQRWGLAAGLGQALLGAVPAVTIAGSVYRYYRAGAEAFLGIGLPDILAQYARNAVHLSVESGVYLVTAGLAGLVVGGLLRLVVAGLEPAGSEQ